MQKSTAKTVTAIVREGKKKPYWAFGRMIPRPFFSDEDIFQLFVSETRNFEANKRHPKIEYFVCVRFVHNNCFWAEWKSQKQHSLEADAVKDARDLIAYDRDLIFRIMRRPQDYAWCKEVHNHFRQPVFGLMQEHNLHSADDWKMYKSQHGILVSPEPKQISLPRLTSLSTSH
jgi:hypothetical protein